MTKIEVGYIGIGGEGRSGLSSEIADVERAAAEGRMDISVTRLSDRAREKSSPKAEDYRMVARSAIEQVVGDEGLPRREPDAPTLAQQRAANFERAQRQKVKEDIKSRFELQIDAFLEPLQEKGTLEAASARDIPLKNTTTNQELLKLLQEKGYISEEMKRSGYLDLSAYMVARLLANKDISDQDKRILVSAHSYLVKETIQEAIARHLNSENDEKIT